MGAHGTCIQKEDILIKLHLKVKYGTLRSSSQYYVNDVCIVVYTDTCIHNLLVIRT